MVNQMVVAAGPDLPLFTVSSGHVMVRQIQIETVAVARAALRRPNALVVLREASEMLRSLRRHCVHNAIVDMHFEGADGTFHSRQPGRAAGTLQKNAKLKQGINQGTIRLVSPLLYPLQAQQHVIAKGSDTRPFADQPIEVSQKRKRDGFLRAQASR